MAGNEAFDRHYVWLFWVNLGVASLLALVILGALVNLVLRMRRGRFGSQLLFKLATVFGLVGVVPGVLIYAVSYQFLNRTIETWFDVKLASALEAGLNLGRGTLDNLVTDLGQKTRDGAAQLAEGNSPQLLLLERLREQMGARSVTLVGIGGQILLESGGDTRHLTPDRPNANLLRQARTQGSASQIEGLEDEAAALQGQAQIRALARLPNTQFRLDLGERYLMVVKRIRKACWATRWPCKPPATNTSNARWSATACAASTWARSPWC